MCLTRTVTYSYLLVLTRCRKAIQNKTQCGFRCILITIRAHKTLELKIGEQHAIFSWVKSVGQLVCANALGSWLPPSG